MKRPKLAVAAISDCISPDRNAKIAELKKHMHIDILGKCGDFRHKECEERHPDCFKMLAKEYYYFVAIENSDYRDYITEKVWRNAFDAGMVPIVWSTVADYAYNLPHNSYINVADYANVAVFYEAIREISSYPHLYRRYHEWRKTHTSSYKLKLWTDMCDFGLKVQGQELPPIDIPSIRHF